VQLLTSQLVVVTFISSSTNSTKHSDSPFANGAENIQEGFRFFSKALKISPLPGTSRQSDVQSNSGTELTKAFLNRTFPSFDGQKDVYFDEHGNRLGDITLHFFYPEFDNFEVQKLILQFVDKRPYLNSFQLRSKSKNRIFS
jgi:hypothetical protein